MRQRASFWQDLPLWVGGGLAAGCLLALGTALLVSEAPLEDAPDEVARAYALDAAADGRSLRLSGRIDFGITRELAELLEAAPELRILRLDSVGGRVAEARGLAGLVQRHGLTTSAAGECSSACTLVFLSASRRYLEPGARLGFHRYGLHSPLVGHFLDPAAEQARDQALFAGREVAASFLERVAATPHETMWFPSPAELLAAGVVDEVRRPRAADY